MPVPSHYSIAIPSQAIATAQHPSPRQRPLPKRKKEQVPGDRQVIARHNRRWQPDVSPRGRGRRSRRRVAFPPRAPKDDFRKARQGLLRCGRRAPIGVADALLAWNCVANALPACARRRGARRGWSRASGASRGCSGWGVVWKRKMPGPRPCVALRCVAVHHVRGCWCCARVSRGARVCGSEGRRSRSVRSMDAYYCVDGNMQ